jgi:hypothetical protein
MGTYCKVKHSMFESMIHRAKNSQTPSVEDLKVRGRAMKTFLVVIAHLICIVAQPVHAGITPSQIDRVVVVTGTGTGVGGMPIYKYDPYVLLRGGAAIRNPRSALEQIDIQSMRASSPNSVGTWQLQGGELVLNFPGMQQPRRVKPNRFYTAIPARAGESLTGRYRTVSGGGNSALGGSFSVMSTGEYTFYADGRFDRGSNTGVSGTGVAGRASGTSGGRYRLNGYTATFIGANGQTQNAFFVFGANPNGSKTTDVIYINASAYLKR